jgi:hypothetical protein
MSADFSPGRQRARRRSNRDHQGEGSSRDQGSDLYVQERCGLLRRHRNTADQTEHGVPCPTNVCKLKNIALSNAEQLLYYHPA